MNDYFHSISYILMLNQDTLWWDRVPNEWPPLRLDAWDLINGMATEENQ